MKIEVLQAHLSMRGWKATPSGRLGEMPLVIFTLPRRYYDEPELCIISAAKWVFLPHTVYCDDQKVGVFFTAWGLLKWVDKSTEEIRGMPMK